MRTRASLRVAVLVALFGAAGETRAEPPARWMEGLNRGVVAINAEKGRVYVGWRMLGDDPENVAFNVYRGDRQRSGRQAQRRTHHRVNRL